MSDDKELIARLRDFEKVTVGDARDAADRIEQLVATNEALTKERDALRSALGRIRPVPERILRGIPVRDLAETLAEADSALSKGESHD